MSRDLYTAAQFIEAISGSGGIISTIAARVGCQWHTAKKYIDTYPTVAAAYQAECERTSDIAEGVIIGNINAASRVQSRAGKAAEEAEKSGKRGDWSAAIIDSADAKWWLSRKRAEQFSERHEVAHSGSVTYILDWGDNADTDD